MAEETGEDQVMTEKNEKEIWRELKQHLMERISEAGSQCHDFHVRSDEATEDHITPARSYFAFASMVYNQFFDVFVLIDSAYDFLLELENRIEVKSAKLQKIMIEMAEHSNVNMKYLKTELLDVKNQMQNPMLVRIDQFLTTYKETEEKRKKLGDQYVE